MQWGEIMQPTKRQRQTSNVWNKNELRQRLNDEKCKEKRKQHCTNTKDHPTQLRTQ